MDLTSIFEDLDADNMKEGLLQSLGLEVRKGPVDYLLPALGIFGAGLAVGCGLGLLLAPRSGRELRNQLGERIGKGVDGPRSRNGPGAAAPLPTAPPPR